MITSFAGSGAAGSRVVLFGAALVSVGVLFGSFIQNRKNREQFIKSPTSTTLATLSTEEIRNLPYPPDVLPGGRDVSTPYGLIRVFEWGPEDGEKFLLVHGISTPSIALGDLASELVGKGYRVMLFDLFGRGYSDAPIDVPHDARLYVTQILLVLASSQLSWSKFHLAGYSLGGCLAVAFTRYLPHLVISLTLIAGSGLIRPHHIGWQSKLLYTSGLLPEWLVRYLVKRRIRPAASPPRSAGAMDIVTAENKLQPGDSDASGGATFDTASISRFRQGVTISSVVAWQVDHHEGFITAFLSTIRKAPVYAPQEDWEVLSSILAERRRAGDDAAERKGLVKGKVNLVLGDNDPVIVPAETIEDATRILGEDGVEYTVLAGGHELPITLSVEVAICIDRFVRE